MNHHKITQDHLQQKAYVYIRQSTMGQVLHHQESTQRQYALKDKATGERDDTVTLSYAVVFVQRRPLIFQG